MQSLEAQDKDPSEWTAKQITLPEIKAWLGLVMAMSIHKLPAIVDYWKDDWILGVPAFARIMSRNRFQEILRYLHVNNNENMLARENENYDKLFKIRPLIESLKINFQIHYNPHCEQSIDEAMVKYKGRTSWKQYMPLNPIKRGIKIWCRADSHAGYLCDFEVYFSRRYRPTFVVIVMLDYVQHHVSVTTILARSWIYILPYPNIWTFQHLGATCSSIHYSSLWSAF